MRPKSLSIFFTVSGKCFLSTAVSKLTACTTCKRFYQRESHSVVFDRKQSPEIRSFTPTVLCCIKQDCSVTVMCQLTHMKYTIVHSIIIHLHALSKINSSTTVSPTTNTPVDRAAEFPQIHDTRIIKYHSRIIPILCLHNIIIAQRLYSSCMMCALIFIINARGYFFTPVKIFVIVLLII